MALAEKIMYIPQKLYRRRYRRDSITTAKFDIRRAYDMLAVIEKIYKLDYQNIKMVSMVMTRNLLAMWIEQCGENGLLDNEELVHIFDEAVEKMVVQLDKSYSPLMASLYYMVNDSIYQNCKIVHKYNIDEVRKQKFLEKNKYLLKIIFNSIHFDTVGYKIGIYGMGECSNRFLNLYEEYFGEIKADVIFIDSKISSDMVKYRGRRVINVSDIKEEQFECILIASKKYEAEMVHNIYMYSGEGRNIIRLGSDLRMI
jgi:hypothetical protein